MKYINHNFFKFVIAGGANTVITYFLFVALLLIWSYQVSYTISYIVGIILSYSLNTFFVFRQPWSWSKLVQFPLVYILQYALGFLVLALLVDGGGMDPRLAAPVNIVVLLPVSYFLSRFIISPKKARSCH